MDRSNMWVPLLASIGVGAATYYTMTKNNQSLGQTMQSVVPFVTQLSAKDKQTLGPYGMS